MLSTCIQLGHAVAQLVEAQHYKPKAAGYIPGRTMAVDSTEPLTDKYRQYFREVKAIGAECWQPYYIHFPAVLLSVVLNILKPSEPK